MELTYATILINHCIGETLRSIGDEDPEKLTAYRTQLPQALHDVAMALFPGDDADCCEIDLDTVRLLVTVQETVCSTVYSLRLCHKGVVWRGELGSPPLIQKVIWIHYDFQIGFKLEFIF